MSGAAYDSISFRTRLGLFDEAERSVPLAGVPQIPDEVHRAITRGDEDELSPEQESLASAAIWQRAAPEIQRRRLARLAGINVDRHFARTREQDEE